MKEKLNRIFELSNEINFNGGCVTIYYGGHVNLISLDIAVSKEKYKEKKYEQTLWYRGKLKHKEEKFDKIIETLEKELERVNNVD